MRIKGFAERGKRKKKEGKKEWKGKYTRLKQIL